MTIRTIRPGGEPLATPSAAPAADSAIAEGQRDQISPMASFDPVIAAGSAFPSSAAALAAGLGGAAIVIGLDLGRQPDKGGYCLVRDGRVDLVLRPADVLVDQAGNVTVAVDARDLGDAT